jgi:hypothetical protein
MYAFQEFSLLPVGVTSFAGADFLDQLLDLVAIDGFASRKAAVELMGFPSYIEVERASHKL